MKSLPVFALLVCVVCGAPKLRTIPDQLPPQLLTLPSNATSIRSEITDSFSCEGRSYGYYADMENDCQIFHVCLPMKYSDGRNQTFRWSFICPDETVFNQEIFTCTIQDDSIPCSESPRYYNLNSNFGDRKDDQEGNEDVQAHQIEDATHVPEVPQSLSGLGRRHHVYDGKKKTIE